MSDFNVKEYAKRNSIDLGDCQCHLVDVIAGRDSPLVIITHNDGGIDIQYELDIIDESDDEDAEETITVEFADTAALDQWLADNEIVLPAKLHDDLRRKTQLMSKEYKAELEDILDCTQRKYLVEYSLSYESSEDEPNYDECSTLDEAFALLRKTGAMSAMPGNSCSIQVGSCELYSSYFTSDGIDIGDSYIDPRTITEESKFLSAIIDAESFASNEHEEADVQVLIKTPNRGPRMG